MPVTESPYIGLETHLEKREFIPSVETEKKDIWEIMELFTL